MLGSSSIVPAALGKALRAVIPIAASKPTTGPPIAAAALVSRHSAPNYPINYVTPITHRVARSFNGG